ncbi:MAG: hypothetical protein HKN21_02410 [Candidatus Eisenbacteria bacterium]|uniref:DUF11 domain-containing protein n=1 Tax=Eiseniibacteriota bacterium TaxID=2212470 RepID=A0A7Y2E5M9_UNCEI|nr:hypothetical protein [Candidatus Eisenbacteria bacterium]
MIARRILGAIFLSAVVSSLALAGGTPVCTEIENQAVATYTIGNTTFTETSNKTTTTVAQLIDVSVIWQDAGNVTVRPGQTERILTFMVTNTGNGPDSFTLSVINLLVGDSFDPIFDDIYLDTNGNGVFDVGADELYVAGSNDPLLLADESIVVFSRNSIPGDVESEDLGDSQLVATSNTGTGDPGDSFPHGECDTDIVIGESGGDDEDTGTYVVSSINVMVEKSQEVEDQFGGDEPVPGACIIYTIRVSAVGSGTAAGVIITDEIPEHTTYKEDSLTLNGTELSDLLDGDAGDVGGTTPNTVTVFLGNLDENTPIQTITFAVTIN